MGQETNAALRRKLRTQRAAYEELLGLAGAIMAALCVRRGDGGTLRLRYALELESNIVSENIVSITVREISNARQIHL